MVRRSSLRRSGGVGIGGILTIVGITALASIGFTIALTSPRGTISNYSNDAVSWIGGVVSAPVNWVKGGFDWAGSIFHGSEQVARLKAENEALLEWRNQARAMAERLDAYEKLHAVQGEAFAKGITARMVSETSGPFSRSGIVNAGQNQGVGSNWLVINQNGLVGRVISTGKNSSRILLLTDSDSKIPIMGETSRGRAILIGDKSDAPYLAHLNQPAIIGNNERLMTSGDDGIYPRGLAVGVAGIAPDRKWRVRLNTNRAAIDFVRLIPPNNFPPPLTRNDVLPNSNTQDGALMPLNNQAAAIPTEQTPSAIAKAQQERISRNTPVVVPKTEPFKVIVKNGATGETPAPTTTPAVTPAAEPKQNIEPAPAPAPVNSAATPE